MILMRMYFLGEMKYPIQNLHKAYPIQTPIYNPPRLHFTIHPQSHTKIHPQLNSKTHLQRPIRNTSTHPLHIPGSVLLPFHIMAHQPRRPTFTHQQPKLTSHSLKGGHPLNNMPHNSGTQIPTTMETIKVPIVQKDHTYQ